VYLNLVGPKFEYASTVWNSITSANIKKQERNHRKFVALYRYRFFIAISVKKIFSDSQNFILCTKNLILMENVFYFSFFEFKILSFSFGYY